MRVEEFWGGGDLVYAAGLTQQFPTASDDSLGTGKYSLGPTAVLSFIGKRFILGAHIDEGDVVASATRTQEQTAENPPAADDAAASEPEQEDAE